MARTNLNYYSYHKQNLSKEGSSIACEYDTIVKSPFIKLPLELIIKIFANLHIKDHYSLLFTSKAISQFSFCKQIQIARSTLSGQVAQLDAVISYISNNKSFTYPLLRQINLSNVLDDWYLKLNQPTQEGILLVSKLLEYRSHHHLLSIERLARFPHKNLFPKKAQVTLKNLYRLAQLKESPLPLDLVTSLIETLPNYTFLTIRYQGRLIWSIIVDYLANNPKSVNYRELIVKVLFIGSQINPLLYQLDITPSLLHYTNTSRFNTINEWLRLLITMHGDQRDIVLLTVKVFGDSLEYVSEKYKDDQEIVLTAIQNVASSIKFASQRLQNDQKVLLSAMCCTTYYIPLIPSSIAMDPLFMLRAVERNGLSIKYATDQLKNNSLMASIAVKQNGLALKYVLPHIRKNRDIILTAIRQNGLALKFAPEEFKNDPEVVLIASMENSSALEFASNNLKKSKEFIFTLILHKSCHLGYVAPELKADENLCLKALEREGKNLEHAPDHLKDDPGIVLSIVRKNGYLLRYASSRLQDDQSIVMAAIRASPYAYQFASPRLQNDEEIRKAAGLIWS
ncbi:MAG: hypothetical protein K0S74_1193 [Chlamydiales bacterium]|jgi:hypothetical protein|nr:hypothetical protein [Chlamydiales bacterium]